MHELRCFLLEMLVFMHKYTFLQRSPRFWQNYTIPNLNLSLLANWKISNSQTCTGWMSHRTDPQPVGQLTNLTLPNLVRLEVSRYHTSTTLNFTKPIFESLVWHRARRSRHV